MIFIVYSSEIEKSTEWIWISSDSFAGLSGTTTMKVSKFIYYFSWAGFYYVLMFNILLSSQVQQRNDVSKRKDIQGAAKQS